LGPGPTGHDNVDNRGASGSESVNNFSAGCSELGEVPIVGVSCDGEVLRLVVQEVVSLGVVWEGEGGEGRTGKGGVEVEGTQVLGNRNFAGWLGGPVSSGPEFQPTEQDRLCG
jgi:hypothetical protein